MPTINVDIDGTTHTIEFEAHCANCGAGLCANVTESKRSGWGGVPGIMIEPCDKCGQLEYDNGYKEAIKETSCSS